MEARSPCRLLAIAVACAGAAASAQNVKIAPLGSHAGEMCDRDRATIFEDPTGVRILYDAGHSVTGCDDPRLGDVHVVLLSHAHGDHMGDRKMRALEAGTCALPGTVSAAHDSTVARELLTEPERKSLDADNVSLTLGPSSGYVVQFTNGLKVYLSGDTGIHAEMKSIVNEAATADGKLKPNSRTAAFVELVKSRPVHLARSGRTMEFDGTAKCVAGC